MLTTEQQTELLGFLNRINLPGGDNLENVADLNYWRLELKPKRLRRNIPDIENTP